MNRLGFGIVQIGMVIIFFGVVSVAISSTTIPVMPSQNSYSSNSRISKPSQEDTELASFGLCIVRQTFAMQMKQNVNNKVPISSSRMILNKRQQTQNPQYKLSQNEYTVYKRILEGAYTTKRNEYEYAFDIYMQCMAEKKVDPMKFITKGREA